MNTAWKALHLYHDGTRFLHIQGKVSLRVGKIEAPLLKRAKDAVKRGFSTAQQGPTVNLLKLVAKEVGYNPHGYSYCSYTHVSLYAPIAAAAELEGVSNALEALMHLEGSASHKRGAFRIPEQLYFSQSATMVGEQRTRLRRFMKEQMARWMIYRQPMLDFLEDPSRVIVWEFDSDYKETRKEINSHE